MSIFESGSVETSIGASLLPSGSTGELKLTCAVPLPRDSWVLKHLEPVCMGFLPGGLRLPD